ncbi:hypothetical protein [Caenimonas sp. SL110]|uniref:hypothetical protein n=1 Tax=Caenimonas sp. SL110 TaxID=1450524 RepID=UPI00128C2D58|nr:hypothetical protein [Caenimonas sp. SL110]
MSTTASRLLTTAAFIASLFCIGVWWPAPVPMAWDFQSKVVVAGIAFALMLGIASFFVRVSRIAAVLVAVWIFIAIHAGGVSAALAFVLFGAGAMAVGAAIVGRAGSLTAIERAVLAYLVGLSLMIAVLSPVLAVAIHYPSSYAAACLLLVFWQRGALWALLQDLHMQWRQWRGGKPSFALAAAIFLAMLAWGYGALGTLTPVASYDDLAFHLRLPTELLVRHFYAFDVDHQIWSAAPLASDLAYAIAYVISQGAEGVKAWVNGSYHLACAVLLAGLLLRRTRPWPAVLCLVGYLSIPLVLAINHTLHTEGISAALVIGIFTLWALARDSQSPGPAIGAALMLASLGASKSSNLVMCLVLGLVWLPTFWRHARARPLMGLAILAALATVITPYVTSWIRSGNPVLPLFNAVFKSPYFEAVNFKNDGYAGKFNGSLFANLFLDGQRHLETAIASAGGMSLYFLVPAAVILLAWKGDIERRVAMGAVLVYSLILLSSQQYLRYLFPVMAIGMFAVSRVWDPLPTDDRKLARMWQYWWSALLGLAILMNLYWMPGVFWQTKPREMIDSALTPRGRTAYLGQYAPERELTRAANADMGIHSRVLYSVDPYGADLHGTPVYANWYNPRALGAMRAVTDQASAGEFMRKERITHMVVKPLAKVHPSVQKPVDELMKFGMLHGKVIAHSANDALIALNDDIVWSRELWRMGADKVGTQVDPKVIVGGNSPVKGGQTILVEVQGTCDKLEARPGVDVFWSRNGKGLGSTGRIEACMPVEGQPGGTFAIRYRMTAPPKADALWIRIASYGELPVTLQVARVRALAP